MKKNALIIVDPQNSFCPGGELAVADGEKIMPVIMECEALSMFDVIVVTRDNHPKDHMSFVTQHDGKNVLDVVKIMNPETGKEVELILWPEHCVEGTFGAQFHKDIVLNSIDPEYELFTKGTNRYEHPFSGFAGKNSKGEFLEGYLKGQVITDIYVCGLATDYCVKDTIVDAISLGFNTYLIKDAAKGVAEDLAPTYAELIEKGAAIITSSHL